MPPFFNLFAVSVLAGFVGSMSGMGGGVILIPLLTWAGYDIKRVIGVSIISVIATSSGSASSYVRDHFTSLKTAMFLEVFTILGAFVGASITLRVPARPLYLGFGLVLIASWATLFTRRNEEWRCPEKVDGFSSWLELKGAYLDRPTGQWIRYQAVRAYWGGPLMFLAGLISGLLGIGAGAVKVLVHDLILRLPPKVSTTTSNLVIGVTALASTSVYLSHGLIDPRLVAPVILGVVLGAFLGTRLLARVHNRTVRYFFLVVLALLGAEMIYRGIGLP
jgi:uncharacterized membrane protein YfcA